MWLGPSWWPSCWFSSSSSSTPCGHPPGPRPRGGDGRARCAVASDLATTDSRRTFSPFGVVHGSGRPRPGVTQVPARIAWAVELLALRPTDRVLEIGCGPGVAASLVAARLDDGSITAIDRSATAIARARARNAEHVRSGRLTLQQATLAEFRTEQRFDKGLAVNVNVFWTTTAAPECSVLRAALAPGGAVHLVYSGPGGDSRSDDIGRVVANLTREGFTTTVRGGPEPGLVCVTGRPA